MIPVQYEPYSANDENSSEKVIHSISSTVSDTGVEMLLAIPVGSKMIFPGDHTLIQIGVIQNVKILKGTQEKLEYLLEHLEDMSSPSSNVGYTKLIEMDIETDQIYHL